MELLRFNRLIYDRVARRLLRQPNEPSILEKIWRKSFEEVHFVSWVWRGGFYLEKPLEKIHGGSSNRKSQYLQA